MAMIYEIWNPTLEVKRAVKLLRPDHTEDSAQRFETEMKISAKLHHPNIVEIYAVGKWNDLPYIEMEEIDGSTVEGVIKECGSLPVDVCTSIAIMVGRALNYAHNQKYVIYGKEYHGVIHRDLKPSNIMVTRKGIVKLMDFGIAKPTTASLVTCGNVVVGTLQYLSPEQLEGKEIDVRADIYSLATVMYEMLTGERAFPQTQLAKLVPNKIESRYVPLEEFDIKVPRALRLLIQQCLHQEKGKRIQNALEFLRALGRVHKRITDDSPEQVLARFMWGSRRERVQVGMRRRSKVLPIMVGTGIAIVLSGLLPFLAPHLGRYLAKRREAAASRIRVAESPRAATAPPETGTVTAERPSRSADEAPEKPGAPRHVSTAREAESPRQGGGDREAAGSPRALQDPGNRNADAPSAEPKPPSKPRPTGKPSVLERLRARYRTRDIMAIFTAEVEAGSYRDALAVFKHLPEQQARGDKAVIYRLRALRGSGDREGARKLLMNTEVKDGELYLAKAELSFHGGDLDEAQALLEKAGSSPVKYVAQQAFRPRLLYSQAMCASARFDRQPGPETKKAAMAAWYKLKSLLRTSPEHRYYKKADAEIRRISRQ
jgi:hypothetical protein